MKAICKLSDITINTGVNALFNDKQLALFRTSTDEIFAIDNLDPFSGANVLSRGIIGETANNIFVASPIYKQRFCLKTGECLDDQTVSLNSYQVTIKDQQVFIA